MCQTIITECKCLLLQRLNLIIHFASKPNLHTEKNPQQITARILMSAWALSASRDFMLRAEIIFVELFRPSNQGSITISNMFSFTIYILYSGLKNKCITTYQYLHLPISGLVTIPSCSNSKKKKAGMLILDVTITFKLMYPKFNIFHKHLKVA